MELSLLHPACWKTSPSFYQFLEIRPTIYSMLSTIGNSLSPSEPLLIIGIAFPESLKAPNSFPYRHPRLDNTTLFSKNRQALYHCCFFDIWQFIRSMPLSDKYHARIPSEKDFHPSTPLFRPFSMSYPYKLHGNYNSAIRHPYLSCWYVGTTPCPVLLDIVSTPKGWEHHDTQHLLS